MTSVCIYFQVHQPLRLRKYSVFDIGKNHNYFDSERNRFYLERIVRKCYLPANRKILELIEKTNGYFKVSFSITGILLEQLEEHFPEVIESFQKLVDTGCVELFNETYYHSLAYLISEKEFIEQVKLHAKKIKDVFGVRANIFRNTEAMFSNDVAKLAEKMGYKGIIAEGLDHILEWRSPNFLYLPKGSNIPVFLRNYRLSDDIAFRFSCREWDGFPLTADKFSAWLGSSHGDVINLFMDYETFGEHQWKETGIFNFLHHLPFEVMKYEHLEFKTPSEILREKRPVGVYDVPYLSSWADVHRDLSAWLENGMQNHAFKELKALEEKVKSQGNEILDAWRKLQISDHFYFMCTKWFADGDVHKYFNPYENPYEAFINYMNVLTDLKHRLGASV